MIEPKSFLRTAAAAAALLAAGTAVAQPGGVQPAGTNPNPHADVFADGGQCVACHSNMHEPGGEDISIGYDWRASIMANAGRYPYWLASVRREVIDHPQARAVIENECGTCHIPAAHYQARAAGEQARIFEHYQDEPPDPALAALARDGVNCSVCHQITAEGLGEPSSFTGGFHIDVDSPSVYGPYDIDAGLAHVMNSAVRFEPAQSDHIRSSEVCATCHTLYTHALDEAGNAVGEFPEQMPFLEWKHSGYRETRSCQDCHMPELAEPAPITSVLGEPRENFSQHVFRCGNAFMLRMLNTYRDELGVEALPTELEASARRTEEFLQTETAKLDIESVTRSGDIVEIAVRIENLAGHKLPSAYPSRRAWLHLAVTGPDGRTLFESGALRPDGSIVGSDSDADASRYKPHYEVIESADQVQVYEPILLDHAGRVTTGLLYAASYGKDNRLLPHGFDKATAPDDDAWPRGELNLPRALVTEKAYPEDESVVTVSIPEGADYIETEWLYEKRFGPRSQFEIAIPLSYGQAGLSGDELQLGDLAVGLKHNLYHSLVNGSIFSVGAEVIVPVGDEDDGFGAGTTIFEPWVAWGQILPNDMFFQAQALGEFAADSDVEDEVALRTAFGRTWTEGPNGFGRAWTPMVEVLASRALESGADTHFDIVPQLQVTLPTRQHIMLNAGARIPVNHTEGRDTVFMVYLLWDWYDGGLAEGW